jgi:hypothetical protein
MLQNCAAGFGPDASLFIIPVRDAEACTSRR